MDNTNDNLLDLMPITKNQDFLHFLYCSDIAVIYLDKHGCIQFLTPIVTTITGIMMDEIGKNISDTLLIQKYPLLQKRVDELISLINDYLGGSVDNLNVAAFEQEDMECTDNTHNTYQIMIHPYLSESADVIGIIIVFYNITKRKNTEKALEIEREKYRCLAALTDCALWEYSRVKNEIKYYQKLKGPDQTTVISDFQITMLLNQWIYPEDIPIFNDFYYSLNNSTDYFEYEFRVKFKNRNYYWQKVQGTVLKDSNGNVLLVIGRSINIDKEHREHEKLLLKSELDSLTGLYNRSAVKEKIEKFIRNSNTENLSDLFSFLIIDIDNFKQANDRSGHLFGDTLLETFASVLSHLFDSNDLIGRIGGDEFIVVQKNIKDKNQIMQTAQSVCDLAKKYLNLNKENSAVTVSIGVAIYPFDGKNFETLYRKADIALYAAKAKGKNRYLCYQPEMDNIQKIAVSEGSQNKLSGSIFKEEAPVIEKRLINIAFDIVSHAKDMATTIHSIFHEIGKFYNLSSITIFELEIPNHEPGFSYQWVNTGIPYVNYPFSRNQEPAKSKFSQLFTDKHIISINDITNETMDSDFRHVYESMGAKAIVKCAIFDSNKVVGSINYVDCTDARQWTKSELDTLYTLTKLISSFIVQIRNKQALDNEIFFTQAMLNNQKLSNYAIKEGTYELLYVSEYTENLFPNVKLGELCYKAIYGREAPCDACPVKGLDEKNKRFSIEAYNEINEFWYSATASTVTMPNGQRMNLICSSDVTGFIERVNSKDPLTGLLTLSKFEADAMKLIVNTADHKYAILYCDFDKFKNINDEWGYSVGNDILILFANKLKEFIRSPEIISRITADKFVMLLSYQDKKSIFERIHKMHIKIMKEMKKIYPKINPVFICGVYFLTPEDKILSIGIDKANLARKTIKGSHKSNISIYDDSFHQKITKEKMIENHMYDALKKDEFIVYMQPKIDLKTLKIIGAEALVRWKMTDGQIISPMEFIPVFERNGFIEELDFYVYEKTFQALHRWLKMGKKPIMVSVNVSRIHLNNNRFIERLDSLVTKYKLPTNLIELEITESMFFKELDRLIFIMNSFRKRGYLISIDDFGSGYSSLNLLKTLPIDILKIDREFFMRNHMGENDKIVISGIITLAKGLGLKVISEGVETVEQAKFLKESSCDMAQGYLFYKPLPMEEFEGLID